MDKPGRKEQESSGDCPTQRSGPQSKARWPGPEPMSTDSNAGKLGLKDKIHQHLVQETTEAGNRKHTETGIAP